MESNWALNVAEQGLTDWPSDFGLVYRRPLLCSYMLDFPGLTLTNVWYGGVYPICLPTYPADETVQLPIVNFFNQGHDGLTFPYGFRVRP